MKYDIAKNEDGPLRRTTRNRTSAASVHAGSSTNATAGPSTPTVKGRQRNLKTKLEVKHEPVESEDDALRHPALDGRLVNIETHLAVRYGRHFFFISSSGR